MISVANDSHHEPIRHRDGHAQVDDVEDHDRLVDELGVEPGMRAQSPRDARQDIHVERHALLTGRLARRLDGREIHVARHLAQRGPVDRVAHRLGHDAPNATERARLTHRQAAVHR